MVPYGIYHVYIMYIISTGKDDCSGIIIACIYALTIPFASLCRALDFNWSWVGAHS